MMLRKCHMGFIQTSKMARNMCFRQIVNICRLSRKTFSVSDLQNKLKLFSFVGNSIDNRIIHQHRARCITTSSRLHNKVSDVSDDQLKKLMDQLGEKFTEARELLDDVRESEGTVYFSADLEDAQQAVTETLEEYNKLLGEISELQKETVVRTIGLRMGELRAQLDAINETLKE